MRRQVIILGSASVLVVVALVVVLLWPDPQPVATTPSGPSFAPDELTPEEATVAATPRPDGTLAVEQTLIFDAGPGSDRPVTFHVGGTRVGWKSSDREVQYGVVPAVSDLRAKEVEGSDLTVRITERPHQNPLSAGRRYELVPPAPWSSGRHAVLISYRLHDVWVRADGVNALVLPLDFAGGPNGAQPADLVRIRLEGATELQCGDQYQLLRTRRVRVARLLHLSRSRVQRGQRRRGE